MSSIARRAGTAASWIIAVALLAVLLSTTWGLASEYGSGPGGLVAFAVLPLGAAFGAAALGGSRWTGGLALGVFVLVTAVGLPVSATLGQRDRLDRLAEADATFTCNGPNAEARIPADVDAAFHVPTHLAGHELYGPISSSRMGCTAAIHGDDASVSFAAWRRTVLATGWRVQRDDTEVVVVRDGVRLTLFVQDDLSMLNASRTGAGACADGRSRDSGDGTVSAC